MSGVCLQYLNTSSFCYIIFLIRLRLCLLNSFPSYFSVYYFLLFVLIQCPTRNATNIGNIGINVNAITTNTVEISQLGVGIEVKFNFRFRFSLLICESVLIRRICMFEESDLFSIMLVIVSMFCSDFHFTFSSVGMSWVSVQYLYLQIFL